MEKTIVKLAEDKRGEKFTFEMIGFNELYVYDIKNKQSMFINKSYGSPRTTIPIKNPVEFSDFVFMSKSLYKSRIRKGDGLLGKTEDLNPDFKLDMTSIGLSALDIERDN